MSKKVSNQHRTSFTSFCLGPFGSEQNPPRIIDGISLVLPKNTSGKCGSPQYDTTLRLLL